MLYKCIKNEGYIKKKLIYLLYNLIVIYLVLYNLIVMYLDYIF